MLSANGRITTGSAVTMKEPFIMDRCLWKGHICKISKQYEKALEKAFPEKPTIIKAGTVGKVLGLPKGRRGYALVKWEGKAGPISHCIISLQLES